MAHLGNQVQETAFALHFISGQRSMLPLDPDYVPSVYSQKKLKTDDKDYDTGSSKGSKCSGAIPESSTSPRKSLRAAKVTRGGNESAADTFTTYPASF